MIRLFKIKPSPKKKQQSMKNRLLMDTSRTKFELAIEQAIEQQKNKK